MLANVCVEHRYEVSLYRHSAFFTIILVFFLCHCPAFLVYVIVRFFLFMSFPDALLFQSLPDLIGQSTTLCLVFQMPPVEPEYDNNKGHYFLVCVIF